jgi:regulator of sigma E protease
MFKTRVEKFYLFFNPWFSLYKKKIGETEWGLGWLPLGGYVKISGMVDESMDTEQLKQDPQPWEFRSKPAWQRLIIMLGGIIVNLFVGFLIYILILWAYGSSYYDINSNNEGLAVGEVLKAHGFRDGDKILSMEGDKIKSLDEASKGVMLRGSRNFEVLHADGTMSKIQLPEDVDYEIFQTEGMTVFNHRTQPILGEMDASMPGYKLGLRENDRVISVNGKAITYFYELSEILKKNKEKTVKLEYSRNDKTKVISAPVDKNGKIGIAVSNELKLVPVSYNLSESITSGIQRGVQTLGDYTSQLKFIFTKKGVSGLGGFATIGNMFGPQWVWADFWAMTAFLSFILAVMNLLPIPALDGGHVMFLIVEMITRRPVPQKFLEYAQMFGVILLLGLMLYANGLDLLRGLGLWK